MTDDSIEHLAGWELQAARQGCTEFSCLYHGAYSREIARRKRQNTPQEATEGPCEPLGCVSGTSAQAGSAGPSAGRT